MIALLIIVIVTISLTAGIGYGIFSLIKSGEVSLGIQKTQTLMLQMSQMIGSKLQSDGARILIPVEIASGGVTNEVPSFIPLRLTAYNKKITYCAVAPTGAAGAYVINSVNGRDYISEGAPVHLAPETLAEIRNAGVVAYLLAPAPNTERDMVCNEIYLGTNGTFNLLADGGFATPIFGDAHSNGSVNWKMNFDVGSEDDLNDALNSIAYNKPADSTINLTTDVNVTTNEINNVTNQLDGRRVTIVNKGSGSNLNFTGTSEPIVITGGVKIENVKMAGNVPVLEVKANGILEVIKSDVGPIDNEMGTTFIGENSYVYGNTTKSAVEIKGGIVKMHQTATVAPRIAPIFKISGGTLYANGKPNIMIAAGSGITDLNSQTVAVTGNGKIESSLNEVGFAIAGGGQPSITLYPLPPVVNDCNGPMTSSNRCVASCQVYGPTAKVISGGCSIPFGPYSAQKFGIDKDNEAYFCQLNGDTTFDLTTTSTAVCAY